jgi:hypothetical protein
VADGKRQQAAVGRAGGLSVAALGEPRDHHGQATGSFRHQALGATAAEKGGLLSLFGFRSSSQVLDDAA